MKNLPRWLITGAVVLAALVLINCSPKNSPATLETGSVIFIHPDGSGVNLFAAMRMLKVGPDGMTEWDQLDHAGIYRSHQLHVLGTSSNAGATAHAFGRKAEYYDFGIHPDHPITALSGYAGSIMTEAIEAGIAVGVINSGHINEPGSAVFLASAESRNEHDLIADRIIHSGADLILSGGEIYLIPEGQTGVFGENGQRSDGRNLIEEARELGYTVVFTAEELNALEPSTKKVLGVFAAVHTFNDKKESELAKLGLPMYAPHAPTLAEMTDYALKFFKAKGRPFILVVEEEGTDNFGNNNNALGTLTALQRADDAMGVARRFVEANPKTLLVTASDSDAGAMQVHWLGKDEYDKPLAATQSNGAPQDGPTGAGSLPFIAKADSKGEVMQFAVSWAAYGDVYGGVIARSHGLNAHLLPVNTDNTDIYRIMYATLFGKWLD